MNFIHRTAVIGSNVILGNNIYIGPFCVIGEPAEFKHFWRNPELVEGTEQQYEIPRESIGVVKIGDNCVFTGHVTIDAGTTGETLIGDNVWMLKHSHVGHDAIIGDNVTISCGAKIGGHTIVNDRCNIGLNAVIHQKQIIEEDCMIGMGSVVTKKLITKPNTKYVGNPAREIGPNHELNK